MKPCHKQKPSPRHPSRAVRAPAAQPSQPPVHRYVHPIRAARPSPRSSVEDLLGDVLEALSRQADQLEEVLRRLERDNSDTM